MQMVLGMFVWSIKTLSYQELQRATKYRYARNNRIGKRAASQFLGPGEERITLPGWVSHELGDITSLEQLRTMAERGEPYVLVSGRGEVFGLYEIEDINETQSLFFPDGSPRKVEFDLSLVRVDDDQVDKVGLIKSIKELLQ